MNMEKKVYCLIDERCKCIKFSSRNDVPDVQIVWDCMMKVAKNDIVLQTMISNKIIVLQKCDPDRNNKLCDIEDDDEIENKDEVKVLLFEKPNIAVEHADITFDFPDNGQISVGETFPITDY